MIELLEKQAEASGVFLFVKHLVIHQYSVRLMDVYHAEPFCNGAETHRFPPPKKKKGRKIQYQKRPNRIFIAFKLMYFSTGVCFKFKYLQSEK